MLACIRIMGIDPGPEKTGFVFWDGDKIVDKGNIDNEDLFEMIKHELSVGDTIFGIEQIKANGMGFGRSTALTAEWAGIFMGLILAFRPMKLQKISRQKVKHYLLGKTSGKDPEVKAAIERRYGIQGSKKEGLNPIYDVEGSGRMASHTWPAFCRCFSYRESCLDWLLS